jgi:integrative and conjugative element protein (TIGR02256 family)
VTTRLFVHEKVFAHLVGVPARSYEVGGWLLGYWTEDGSSMLVTHATPPASRGTPYGVHISGRGHRPRFEQAWKASGGLVTFLGDWHTHPGSPPYPSTRDEATLVKLATNVEFGTPTPLIAIVSTPRYPWRHGAVTIGFYLGSGKEAARSVKAHVTSQLPTVAQGVPAWRWPKDRARRRGPSAGRS